ncbi:MAG: alpha/beta hydrolase [Thiobacillaceae bacterium]
METLVNDPVDNRRGVAFIAHPHPLHGGSMDNKVVQTLARTAFELGMVAVRPNFRGVGQSEGQFDNGRGETADMMDIIQFVMGHYEGLPIYLAGFSFGAYVQHRVAQQRAHEKLLLIAPAVNLYEFQPVPPSTLFVHGDQDEIVPLAEAQRFAKACHARFSVIPHADHFFHKKLKELAAIVEDAWRY